MVHVGTCMTLGTHNFHYSTKCKPDRPFVNGETDCWMMPEEAMAAGLQKKQQSGPVPCKYYKWCHPHVAQNCRSLQSRVESVHDGKSYHTPASHYPLPECLPYNEAAVCQHIPSPRI